ncbi:MAG: Xaa-Pro dipeptidase [Thermoanaerobaculia bacterium]
MATTAMKDVTASTPVSATALYSKHVAERQTTAARALQETGYDRLLIHAGRPFEYFADDQEAPFHATPHFAHWAPVEGPDHLLEIVPGRRPRLFRVTPRDFWYEAPAPADEFVSSEIDIVDVLNPKEAWATAGAGSGRTAFLGGPIPEGELVAADDLNPAALVHRLDWERSYKSDYEVACLVSATARAAAGFRAAEAAFTAGASEMEIHHAYLAAVGSMEEALPYPTIIGLNERASTLHYHGKRGRNGAHANVMLIDAGATVRGYGCDITRTFASAGADPVFRFLLEGMEKAQQSLAREARPGRPYLALHLEAHRKIAALLIEAGILKGSTEDAVAQGLSQPFFPHGLGHFLGIQVHDVAGKQADREGTPAPPPQEQRYLRTTRMIEERQLFTIEPGLYFIPMLLEPFRTGRCQDQFDWALIDRLIPCGGIRIEDNIYVEKESNRNLTREAIPS